MERATVFQGGRLANEISFSNTDFNEIAAVPVQHFAQFQFRVGINSNAYVHHFIHQFYICSSKDSVLQMLACSSCGTLSRTEMVLWSVQTKRLFFSFLTQRFS